MLETREMRSYSGVREEDWIKIGSGSGVEIEFVTRICVIFISLILLRV